MTAKVERYIKHRLEGKSKKQSALDAGYCNDAATHPTAKIENTDAYQIALYRDVPADRALKVLAAQTKATKVGAVIDDDMRMVADNQARLKAAEMILKLHGKFEADNYQQAEKCMIVIKLPGE